MNRRDTMIQIAQDSIEISKKGEYQIGNRLYRFDTANDTKLFVSMEEVINEVKKKAKVGHPFIEVVNEGTVDAIFRLSKNKQKNLSLGVLNFASAYNPGGGFESGAMAQEECLAYCSDLFMKQTTGEGKEYYEINRRKNNPIYTDTMFMSNVTFFRNSRFNLVSNPTMCNVLTCPAVNIGALRGRVGTDMNFAKETMKNRMRKILYLFAYYGCEELILGAFGCGVFGNNPEDVARNWFELLFDEGLGDYFKYISFSIIDRNGRDSNINIFNEFFI